MILHILLAFGVCILVYLGFIAENSKYSIKFFELGARILDDSKQATISRSRSLTDTHPQKLLIKDQGN